MKQLQVSAVNTSGDNLPRQELATVYVNVNEGYNTDNFQIAVSTVYEQQKRPRVKELINITFPNAPVWSGDSKQLQEELVHERHAMAEIISCLLLSPDQLLTTDSLYSNHTSVKAAALELLEKFGYNMSIYNTNAATLDSTFDVDGDTFTLRQIMHTNTKEEGQIELDDLSRIMAMAINDEITVGIIPVKRIS